MTETVFDFSKTILNLNKEKKFKETLKYFKDNKEKFPIQEITNNDYLISSMITALRHTDHVDNAFSFLVQFNIQIDENTPERILQAYGWLLYDKYKLENKVDDHDEELDVSDDEQFDLENVVQVTKSETLKLIEEFIPLMAKFDNDFANNVLAKIFNVISKTEKKKPNPNWQIMNELCDLIPYKRLKTTCEKMEVERKGRLVEMEFASDKENWYAFKSQALMRLEKFEECFAISTEALQTFEKFHYSNDVWFARRIALSKKQLGDSESAILELQNILKRKREWFIEKEIAELYMEKDDSSNAFKFAISAANNFGDLEYKVDLISLIGELLISKQEAELAFKHFYLVQLIRETKGWKIPEKLAATLSQFSSEDYAKPSYSSLERELINYWKSASADPVKTTTFHTGIVNKILHDNDQGIDGFINCSNGSSVYFRVHPDDINRRTISFGSEVKFKILPAIEDKKERAIHVQPI